MESPTLMLSFVTASQKTRIKWDKTEDATHEA